MDDHEDQYRMNEEQQEVPQRARFLPRFLFADPTAVLARPALLHL